MKKITLLAIILLVVSVGLLSGCTELKNVMSPDASKFVGTWSTGGYIPAGYTFFSDGTCSVSGLSGSWELKEGKLVINIMNEGVSIVYGYQFSEDDTILELTDMGSGHILTFIKQ